QSKPLYLLDEPETVPDEIDTLKENLIRINLPNELPKLCGIYFLCYQNNVVYVGKSIDFFNREKHHRRDKVYDDVLFIVAPEARLDTIERIAIKSLKPEYNKAGINDSTYDDYGLKDLEDMLTRTDGRIKNPFLRKQVASHIIEDDIYSVLKDKVITKTVEEQRLLEIKKRKLIKEVDDLRDIKRKRTDEILQAMSKKIAFNQKDKKEISRWIIEGNLMEHLEKKSWEIDNIIA
ncbi:MAG: hypothetical protein KAR20_17670, partial [Candidatus Heimdallarchaeota archaeon]|nr:hypothetical protein [Candidatus Heimdallarchaeota archaeon]